MKTVSSKWQLRIEMYSCTVHLEVVPTTKGVCEKINTLCKKHKMAKINDPGDSAYGQCLSAFEHYYMILSKDSLKDANTYLHELYHITDLITKDREIDDEEASAYLQGYVGNFFLNKLFTITPI